MVDPDADDADSTEFDLKARLRARRLELNLSQEEVAKRAGLSYRRYQAFEGDARPFNPTLATLRRLAEALETTLSVLLVAPGEVVSVLEAGSTEETPGGPPGQEPSGDKTMSKNASTAPVASTAQETKKKGKKKRVRKKR